MILRRWFLVASLLAVIPAHAAELNFDAGAMSFQGQLQASEGPVGEFAIGATLSDGNFSGHAMVSIAGTVLDAELVEARSYLENGKCILYLEQGRSRFELRGLCDDTSYGGPGGGFDAFIAGQGQVRGEMTGFVSVATGPGQRVEKLSIAVPMGKLTCAWQEVHVSAEASVPNEYLLANSMMIVLTLSPDGAYRTAASKGTYQLAGSRIVLTSGTFAGAVGTLERDRSGDPAVVFYKADNKNADGTQVIDPETTRCTMARQFQ